MAVNLCVVSGFVAAQISPHEYEHHHQGDRANDDGHSQTGIGLFALPPAEVSLRGIVRPVRWMHGCFFLLWSSLFHKITCFSNIASRLLLRSQSPVPMQLWRRCG